MISGITLEDIKKYAQNIYNTNKYVISASGNNVDISNLEVFKIKK